MVNMPPLWHSVVDAEFGTDLEDEDQPLLKAHNGTMAALRKEQARRSYENDLDAIKGAD